MDLSTLTAGLANPATLIPQIIKERRQMYEEKAFLNYEPEGHKVNNHYHRKDRIKRLPIPGAKEDDNGNVPMETVIESVARIALALQKLIVKTAAIFATGGDTVLTADDEVANQTALLKAVKGIWKKNKLRYKNGPLFKTVISQLEAAEIWYSQTERDENNVVTAARMKVRFYFPADGWELLPTFDNYGDMIAFCLKYRDAVSGKQFLDLYTAVELRKYVQESGYGWQEREPAIALPYGKIPVVYYEVSKSEFEDVQSLIDEQEKLLSVFADAIHYNAWPILGLFGKPVSLPTSGEAGKAIEFEEGADARYLGWDQKPEAVIAMNDILTRQIYSLTQTPDLSFEAMRGLGDVSGIAFKRMLIGAHAKAKDAQEGWYGEGIQRRLNFLVEAAKTVTPALAGADIDITPTFNLFDIEDQLQAITNAKLANGGKAVISHIESVAMAALTDDAEETYRLIKEEEREVTDNEDSDSSEQPTEPAQ